MPPKKTFNRFPPAEAQQTIKFGKKSTADVPKFGKKSTEGATRSESEDGGPDHDHQAFRDVRESWKPKIGDDAGFRLKYEGSTSQGRERDVSAEVIRANASFVDGVTSAITSMSDSVGKLAGAMAKLDMNIAGSRMDTAMNSLIKGFDDALDDKVVYVVSKNPKARDIANSFQDATCVVKGSLAELIGGED
jgi:hypothetical protein